MAQCYWQKSSGMIGIAKSFTALNRWGLTFNLRSQISKYTKEMLKVSSHHSVLHKETNMSRRKRDTKDEEKILLKLKYFGVFSEDKSIQLRNIVTKDQATTEITKSLLSAKKNGQFLLKEFLEERLIIL